MGLHARGRVMSTEAAAVRRLAKKNYKQHVLNTKNNNKWKQVFSASLLRPQLLLGTLSVIKMHSKQSHWNSKENIRSTTNYVSNTPSTISCNIKKYLLLFMSGTESTRGEERSAYWIVCIRLISRKSINLSEYTIEWLIHLCLCVSKLVEPQAHHERCCVLVRV